MAWWIGSPIENNRDTISNFYKFKTKNKAYFGDTSFLGDTSIIIPSPAFLLEPTILSDYLKLTKILHKSRIPYKVVSELDIGTNELEGTSNLIMLGNSFFTEQQLDLLLSSFTKNHNLVLVSDSENKNKSRLVEYLNSQSAKLLDIKSDLSEVEEQNNLSINEEERALISTLRAQMHDTVINITGVGAENIAVVTRQTRDHHLVHVINYNSLLHVGWRWEDQLNSDENTYLDSISINLSNLIDKEVKSALRTSPDEQAINITMHEGMVTLQDVGPYTLLIINK